MTRGGNGVRGKSGARVRRMIERAEQDGWETRRRKNRERFLRKESGWLDTLCSNLNLFATGVVLIKKGKKP